MIELLETDPTASEYGEIVQWLEALDCQYGDGKPKEAAETIIALVAEKETLFTQLEFDEMRQRAEAAAAERDTLREALTKIACYGDTGANNRLEATGSYGMFDEPGSVELARTALNQESGDV